MAFSASITKKTVFGDERVLHMVVTADDASGTVDTGLGSLNSVHVTTKSMSTYTTFGVMANYVGASTASAGSIYFHGTNNGDELYVTAYGR